MAREFDPVTNAYVLRVTLADEDARSLECAALCWGSPVEDFARRILMEYLARPPHERLPPGYSDGTEPRRREHLRLVKHEGT
jgi:hypothetical protein